ncbi:hypothetical protein E2C01_020761 [Portunus trituberculatus]|uniref:Uncharacterized protein n=1 Tax=Portunus trituberculatus TaxID=210409 RepID=A0A5B7E370_PORTR|nr:hypothetical protein [Portunus trituberculatus]
MEVDTIDEDLSLPIVQHTGENQNQTHTVKQINELVVASDMSHPSILVVGVVRFHASGRDFDIIVELLFCYWIAEKCTYFIK